MNNIKLSDKDMKRVYWVISNWIIDRKSDKNKQLSSEIVKDCKRLQKKFKGEK